MIQDQHPGGRIRSLRQSQGRTLDDIAEACGFTREGDVDSADRQVEGE